MNRAWSELEMRILRYYASRTACRHPLILVANGPIHHYGGAVHRRLRDALVALTALCAANPSARLLTLMADPAIQWPRRKDFARASLRWPQGTDLGAIDLGVFDARPPLVISLFRRLDALPHPAAAAVCYHIDGLLAAPLSAPGAAFDFDEWRARPLDVAYVGNDRSVARRKANGRYLGDGRLASASHGLSAKHCEGWALPCAEPRPAATAAKACRLLHRAAPRWPGDHAGGAARRWANHVAGPTIAMEEVAAAHARARYSLVTCDPRHAQWEVGATIRVVTSAPRPS
jgi:hypothetical protein